MSCSSASSASDAAGFGREKENGRANAFLRVLRHPSSDWLWRITPTRFARFVADSISRVALASLLTEFFCTSSLGMLNAPLRLILQAPALRAHAALPAPSKRLVGQKAIYYRCFSSVAKKCVAHCSAPMCNASHAWPALIEAQHLVSARGPKLCNVQKHWCFCRAVVIR